MTKTTMNEIIEKMAKAMYCSVNQCEPFAEAGTSDKYLDYAKAALEALSEYIEFLPEDQHAKGEDVILYDSGILQKVLGVGGTAARAKYKIIQRNNKPVIQIKEE